MIYTIYIYSHFWQLAWFWLLNLYIALPILHAKYGDPIEDCHFAGSKNFKKWPQIPYLSIHNFHLWVTGLLIYVAGEHCWITTLLNGHFCSFINQPLKLITAIQTWRHEEALCFIGSCIHYRQGTYGDSQTLSGLCLLSHYIPFLLNRIMSTFGVQCCSALTPPSHVYQACMLT